MIHVYGKFSSLEARISAGMCKIAIILNGNRILGNAKGMDMSVMFVLSDSRDNQRQHLQRKQRKHTYFEEMFTECLFSPALICYSHRHGILK